MTSELKDDIEFCKILDPMPTFEDFNDYVEKYKDVDAPKTIQHLEDALNRLGAMSFTRMVEDGLNTVKKDGESGKRIEITKTIEEVIVHKSLRVPTKLNIRFG